MVRKNVCELNKTVSIVAATQLSQEIEALKEKKFHLEDQMDDAVPGSSRYGRVESQLEEVRSKCQHHEVGGAT